MKSKRQLLRGWRVYAILDDSLFPDSRQLLEKFYNLLESPVDVIQLRFRDFTGSGIYRTAEKMVAAADRKEIPLIINDRPEVALSLGATGVHLGKGDIPVAIARRMLGSGAIIGRTIRGPGDIGVKRDSSEDYVAIGPVFRTPLKPGLKTVSRSLLRELCRSVRIPLVAVGGINRGNVREIIAEGIRTVAFARYGIAEKNTREKIEELKRIMEESMPAGRLQGQNDKDSGKTSEKGCEGRGRGHRANKKGHSVGMDSRPQKPEA